MEDLVYDLWPGTRVHCDCLEREGDRSYFLDIKCDKTRDETNNDVSGEHKSDDCHDRHGLAPIVQNRFRGIRYCGKRSPVSFLEL